MCPLIAPSEIGRGNWHELEAGDAEIAAVGTGPVCEGEGLTCAGGVVQQSTTAATEGAIRFNTRMVCLTPLRGEAAVPAASLAGTVVVPRGSLV